MFCLSFLFGLHHLPHSHFLATSFSLFFFSSSSATSLRCHFPEWTNTKHARVRYRELHSLYVGWSARVHYVQGKHINVHTHKHTNAPETLACADFLGSPWCAGVARDAAANVGESDSVCGTLVTATTTTTSRRRRCENH